MLVQFLVWIAVVLLAERIARWGKSPFAMLGPVLAALLVGSLIGAFAGFLLTRKLLRRGSPGGQPLKLGDE